MTNRNPMSEASAFQRLENRSSANMAWVTIRGVAADIINKEKPKRTLLSKFKEQADICESLQFTLMSFTGQLPRMLGMTVKPEMAAPETSATACVKFL